MLLNISFDFFLAAFSSKSLSIFITSMIVCQGQLISTPGCSCNFSHLCYNITHGDMAQLGERCVRNAETAGSNPVVSIIKKC